MRLIRIGSVPNSGKFDVVLHAQGFKSEADADQYRDLVRYALLKTGLGVPVFEKNVIPFPTKGSPHG